MYLCFPSIGFAQDTSKVTLVSDFWEVIHPSAEISGARIVGFAAVGKLDVKAETVPVKAIIPKDWANSLTCLKVISANGIYESENTYAVSEEWGGGPVDLEYPSSEFEHLNELTQGSVAALLLHGDCSAVSSDASQLVWGYGETSTYRILLNTSRADETFIFFPESPDIPDVVCETVTLEGRNAFDTYCEMPREMLNSSKIKATIVSFKNGEMGREVPMTLWFEASRS